MTTQHELPITGYRVFFPDGSFEDYSDVDSAWNRRCEYLEQLGGDALCSYIEAGGTRVPGI